MARIRSDKPESYQSETLAEVSLAAERTFRGIATIADDRGRLADKPAQINGELWSMRSEREPHTRDDLEAELQEMLKAGLICRYEGCDGKQYLHPVKWDAHQKIDRPSKSRLPRCPIHQAAGDYCGRHEGECPPREDSHDSPDSSMQTREGSRGLDEEPRAIGDDSMQDLGSRTVDLGSRITSARATLDADSRALDADPLDKPAAPDAGKPRRSSKAEDPQRARHAGDVVAAFVDGAKSTGQPEPATSLKGRVGRDARQLLSEGYEVDALIKSAFTMGAGEWNDLAVQVRKDAAATGGGTSKPGGHQPYRNPPESAYDTRFSDAQ